MRSVLEDYVELEGLGDYMWFGKARRRGQGRWSRWVWSSKPYCQGHQATRKLVGCVCVCRQVEGQGLCVQTTPGLLECRQVSCEAHVWHQRMNSGSYLINGSKNLLIIWFSAPQ